MAPFPPKNKRKTDAATGASSSLGVQMSRPAANKPASKVLERRDALFQRYADKESPGVIGPEGIERFCMNLGVETLDVRVLMLAWKMQAAKQGYFTLEEWRKCLRELKVDTIGKLKKALPALEQEVMRPANFRDFYTYSFQYSLTEERQKCLEIESACQLLELVLGNRNRALVESLVEYLKIQKVHKAVNLDQWICFLQFCNEFNYPNFENYDSSQSWPTILDDYVEWAQARQS